MLPDGRELFADVSFRVGEGAKVALVGPNGAGKTTLLRMVAGDLPTRSGSDRPGRWTGRDAPVHRDDRRRPYPRGPGPVPGRAAAARRPASAWPPRTPRCARRDRAKAQLAYANALAAWGEAGGYDAEVLFDTVAVAILGKPWEEVRSTVRCGPSPAASRSGSPSTCCCAARDEVLLLDEPDNFLDVPGKRWLEARLRESSKSVLFVSHDRELLAQTADRVVAVEGGGAWTHPGGFASWHEARAHRHERLEETAAALGRGAREAAVS